MLVWQLRRSPWSLSLGADRPDGQWTRLMGMDSRSEAHCCMVNGQRIGRLGDGCFGDLGSSS